MDVSAKLTTGERIPTPSPHFQPRRQPFHAALRARRKMDELGQNDRKCDDPGRDQRLDRDADAAPHMISDKYRFYHNNLQKSFFRILRAVCP